MSVAGNEGPNGGDRGLRPVEPNESIERKLGTPFAAMAEALRANAEALQRIDSNQRKIAESIEKGDKAGQVITSTRALNETFRGLAEIQRGLLQAVVGDRGRGRGLPFAFAAIAILAGLTGFLVYERWSAADTVSREIYEQAQRTSEDRNTQLAGLRASQRDWQSQKTYFERQLADRDGKLGTLERDYESLERTKRQLESDLAAKESRIQNFLQIKEIADRAGAVEVRNQQLERENHDLRQRTERLEKERDRLLYLLGEKRIDERGPDTEAIKKAFQDQGVIPKPEAKPDPEGPQPLASGVRRRMRRQLNSLLEQAPGDETYEVIAIGGVKDGAILTDVRLGHYRNAGMLNSLHCKELEIWLDEERDTAELRCRGGHISVTRNPGQTIPFDEAGHSVFLKGVGIKAWLERAVIPVSIGPKGRLAWKTGPG